MSAPTDDARTTLHPAGWAAPRGYSHGVVATGRQVVLAGQVGWDPATGEFASDDLVGQTAQALRNVVTLLAAAGAGPRHLVRMTWFVTDRAAYMSARRDLAPIWRELIGPSFPPMSVVFVSALVEERALIEIEATAMVEDRG
ncbi:MAG TPA: RidA family protein [Gemmatimonadaceae bacterium]|nr:RidA family protein [Gemmatimonadaceae bacterium]